MQRLPQRHDRQYESAQSGFTLIELLLSIVIFAVVLTAVNGVLFGALKLRNKTTHSLDLILPIEHASLVVRRDLEGLVPPGGAFAVSLKSGAVTGVSSADTGLEFYSNTGSLSDLQPWGNIQRVGYLLMDSTNRVASMRSGKDLVRVVTRNLLSPTQETPNPQHLLEGVQSLQFEFYDGTQWKNTWDSTSETTVVPLAIRFSLALIANDDEENDGRARTGNRQQTFPLQWVCPVLVSANTNTTTQASAPNGGANGGGGTGGGNGGGGGARPPQGDGQ